MLWQRWPFLVETEPGIWRLPAEYEARLPLMFSLRAKPAGGLTPSPEGVQ